MVKSPIIGLDTKTYWLTDRQSQCDSDSDSDTPPLWSSGQSSWLHNGAVLCFLWGTNWIDIC
jgi:hypothetical protein